jgi:hypothetical protein
MPSFWVVDLTGTGEVRLKQEYEYRLLEPLPGAMDLIGLFSMHLWRSPEEFLVSLPGGGTLNMRWRSVSETSGYATLRDREELVSLSVFLCGREPEDGAATLKPLQLHLVRELHDTGFEPAFDLMNIRERPLLASINFRSPEGVGDQLLSALADRCFAASYFRKQGLA